MTVRAHQLLHDFLTGADAQAALDSCSDEQLNEFVILTSMACVELVSRTLAEAAPDGLEEFAAQVVARRGPEETFRSADVLALLWTCRGDTRQLAKIPADQLTTVQLAIMRALVVDQSIAVDDLGDLVRGAGNAATRLPTAAGDVGHRVMNDRAGHGRLLGIAGFCALVVVLVTGLVSPGWLLGSGDAVDQAEPQTSSPPVATAGVEPPTPAESTSPVTTPVAPPPKPSSDDMSGDDLASCRDRTCTVWVSAPTTITFAPSDDRLAPTGITVEMVSAQNASSPLSEGAVTVTVHYPGHDQRERLDTSVGIPVILYGVTLSAEGPVTGGVATLNIEGHS